MTLRIFESVFYKSLIRACSFDNSLAASQNARSYVQTIDHRALRICKKRIQKVLMLSSFFLINSSSYLLSDSYNGTLFKSLHSVYVKWYWLISFVFVNGRLKRLMNTDWTKSLCDGLPRMKRDTRLPQLLSMKLCRKLLNCRQYISVAYLFLSYTRILQLANY